MSLQRVRLKEDLMLEDLNAQKLYLNVAEEEVDWFVDVSGNFNSRP